MKNASIKEIEQWCCSGIEQKFECQFSNKKPKKINLDLNIIPEDQ
ncbi:hypothetical protein [Vaccinium witches'-broom phytoplasma]|nr:hypothetical protein [Vaccinium witches'-broom phytoplasma]